MTVNFTDIERAHQRIAHLITRTPLLNSPRLDALAGRRLWLKAEPLQVTGSFKFRGACSAISALSNEALSRGVIAYSSGNHAQGIALAAKLFKTRATIVMPHDAPANKVTNTRAYGADVVHYERGVESREDIGADLARKHGLTLVKPYDDPAVIAGQGCFAINRCHGRRFQRGGGQIGIDQLAAGRFQGGFALGASLFLGRAHHEHLVSGQDHQDQAQCDKQVALIFAHENSGLLRFVFAIALRLTLGQILQGAFDFPHQARPVPGGRARACDEYIVNAGLSVERE